MRSRSALVAVLTAALTGAVALTVAASPPAAAATPVRVMPLGDSITGSPGCWRSILWNRLQSTGYRDVDFVGTLGPQGCAQAYDGDNEGHGGALVTNVANANQLPGWLAAARPDIVLMHFGTNDVWSNRPTATILEAYTKLVGQMRASNPAMKVLVAQIIPMRPSTCAECGQRAVALNAAIPGWAASVNTAQSPVVVVDQWTGFDPAADTYDGVHPNTSGDTKMANRWYPALTAALGGTTPTGSPTPSPTRSASPTPSPTRSASPTPSPSRSVSPSPTSASPTPAPTSAGPTTGCTASYTVAGQWQGGFQGEVTVRNSGTATSTGWTVSFDFADGQRLSQSWNAAVTQTGTRITARPAAWNGTLAAGQAASWGFIASWTGSNTVPRPVCTLG